MARRFVFDALLLLILVVLLGVYFSRRVGAPNITKSLRQVKQVKDDPKTMTRMATAIGKDKEYDTNDEGKDYDDTKKNGDGDKKEEEMPRRSKATGTYTRAEETKEQKDETLRVKENDDIARAERETGRMQNIVSHMEDARPSACAGQQHGSEIPATIIIDFFDYSFTDMKMTIASVLKNTPDSLIREIIIVDDGSTIDYIIKNCVDYVDKIPKAVLVRLEQRQGQAHARDRGAQEAMGANLVFLDTKILVNKGWIEPLIGPIQNEKSLIASPMYDRLNDLVEYGYKQVQEVNIASFSWNLAIKLTTSTHHTDALSQSGIESPVARGNVLAMTKEYYKELGGYDLGFPSESGENLELSLRAWLCGGKIKMYGCSRVALFNLYEPVKIISTRNTNRILELWMPDKASLVYQFQGLDKSSNSISEADRASVTKRKESLKHLQCTTIDTYLEKVARDIFVPSPDAVQYGQLHLKSGVCARIGNDSKLVLGGCASHELGLLPRDLVWQLMKDGSIRNGGGKCVSVKSTYYAEAFECNVTRGDDNQMFEYKNNNIISKKSGSCLVHVTDPDPKYQHRQIIMAQGCDFDKTDKKEFSTFSFDMPR